ncbi:hypothetical protein B9Z55_014856 [Caenorhabditis nigoni]|uniref:Sm domain-containing protein n=1 Tax=Caenorhabditis nigoni TaxID=1611254 RepID=A0A2G5U8B9_9PELO|nr:hypothetical protein B9Z55_014856 [Caenorhabditis nigoni]
MNDDFDIEKFTIDLKETHPDLVEGLEDTSDSGNEFQPDAYEQKMIEEHPELAERIYESDVESVKEEQEKRVSNKQKDRNRRANLEKMMVPGRKAVEDKEGTFHDNILKMKEDSPMKMLADAVRDGTKIHVRTRAAVRIDRVFEGIPMTFDEHFNIMMRDVTETILHGRKSRKDVSSRKQLQSLLPEYLQWKEGTNWPLPIGANSLLEERCQRACFIKGDSVVLLYKL